MNNKQKENYFDDEAERFARKLEKSIKKKKQKEQISNDDLNDWLNTQSLEDLLISDDN